jgi:DNA-binding transcriptional MerR regulator
MRQFTTKTIEEATGLKRNTLHYYIEAGAIVPEDPGRGRGTRRVLSRKNFIEAAILKRLLDLGLTKTRNLQALNLIRQSQDWKDLNIKALLELRPTYLFFLLHNNALSMNVLVEEKRKPVTFSDISDEEFLEGLNNPQSPVLEMVMDHHYDIVTIIDLVALAVKYRSYLL